MAKGYPTGGRKEAPSGLAGDRCALCLKRPAEAGATRCATCRALYGPG